MKALKLPGNLAAFANGRDSRYHPILDMMLLSSDETLPHETRHRLDAYALRWISSAGGFEVLRELGGIGATVMFARSDEKFATEAATRELVHKSFVIQKLSLAIEERIRPIAELSACQSETEVEAYIESGFSPNMTQAWDLWRGLPDSVLRNQLLAFCMALLSLPPFDEVDPFLTIVEIAPKLAANPAAGISELYQTTRRLQEPLHAFVAATEEWALSDIPPEMRRLRLLYRLVPDFLSSRFQAMAKGTMGPERMRQVHEAGYRAIPSLIQSPLPGFQNLVPYDVDSYLERLQALHSQAMFEASARGDDLEEITNLGGFAAVTFDRTDKYTGRVRFNEALLVRNEGSGNELWRDWLTLFALESLRARVANEDPDESCPFEGWEVLPKQVSCDENCPMRLFFDKSAACMTTERTKRSVRTSRLKHHPRASAS